MSLKELILRLENKGIAERDAPSVGARVEAEPADGSRDTIRDPRATGRILTGFGIGDVPSLLDGEGDRHLARQTRILAKLGLVAAGDRLQTLLDLSLNERRIELATASNVTATVEPHVPADLAFLDRLTFSSRLAGALGLFQRAQALLLSAASAAACAQRAGVTLGRHPDT